MPTYEFLCERCGKAFELQLSMSQSSLMQECPKCCGRAKRIPSVPAWRPDKTIKP